MICCRREGDSDPTPGPTPLAEARERGGDRYKSEAFPKHFDPIN